MTIKSEGTTPDSPAPESTPEAKLRERAHLLRATVVALAEKLDPFPPFYGMMTLQAIELEMPSSPEFQIPTDLGCVVILPTGEISELDLRMIPGAVGPVEVDHVEQLTELDLTPEQYIAYATTAIQVLQVELARQG